jgi:hypothetical protein
MSDREVMQQALNFLTSDRWGTVPYMDIGVYDDAEKLAESLRACLAEPEPVTFNTCPTCQSLARAVMLDQTGRA